MVVPIPVKQRGTIAGQVLCCLPRLRLIISEDKVASSLPGEGGAGQTIKQFVDYRHCAATGTLVRAFTCHGLLANSLSETCTLSAKLLMRLIAMWPTLNQVDVRTYGVHKHTTVVEQINAHQNLIQWNLHVHMYILP